MAKEPGTAFISYTRQGGAACAERLHRMLREQGLGVWQDRAQMIAGVDFWRQIEEAIERCSHLVMVLTPDCFEGDRRVLRQEWYRGVQRRDDPQRLCLGGRRHDPGGHRLSRQDPFAAAGRRAGIR
jgi:hypothetical protein